ncbi:aspartate kinase [Peribacillus deserti]|uniref:Aspartokinase n=1 Tax=Peribacillus deserti TaxID=673318 RepID=A0ABS2QKD1_9BACI|nr:aspartate kinase [Peribacillus deserti]MBM7693613.1 aspartate kinase [Peribacillus deserti]
MKVVKFGGSSLASGEQFKKVLQIILSDTARKIVVVSAPGKRSQSDKKVTDLLIENAEYFLKYREINEGLLEQVVNRYSSIAEEVGIRTDIVSEIKADIKTKLQKDFKNEERYIDEVKASGEDNNARLLAAYFKEQGKEACYINPFEAGLFVTDQPGNAQVLPESYENLSSLKERSGILVFPGFFGYSKDGQILTFSRSGSDITGSILANAIKAELYENFTDVDAVYSANPFVVKNPKEIRELTYREMRELSYAGFSVLHDEALIPAFRAGIPVNIKNTNNPSAPGTKIVNTRTNTNGPVIGIASAKGFCSIYVSKYLMNRELGFGRKLLHILEDYNLSYEHSPSGIDDISIILREDGFGKEIEEAIISRIFNELEADEVKIERDLALIMVVGEGMRHNVGTTARASKALAGSGVNIEMINQGSSEVSMMFGVKEVDEKRAVISLYEEFFVSIPV